MTRSDLVNAALGGNGTCWCHARFGLAAEAADSGLCGRCKNRSPSACLRAHTAERVKELDAAGRDLAAEVAAVITSMASGSALEQAEAVLRRLGEAA